MHAIREDHFYGAWSEQRITLACLHVSCIGFVPNCLLAVLMHACMWLPYAHATSVHTQPCTGRAAGSSYKPLALLHAQKKCGNAAHHSPESFWCRSAAELAAEPAKRIVRVLQAAGFSGSDAAAAVDAAGGDGPSALATLCAQACAALPGASRQRALADLPDVHSAPLSSSVAAEKALPAVKVIRSSACLVRSLAVSLLLGVPWQHICCGLVCTGTFLRARHSHAVRGTTSVMHKVVYLSCHGKICKRR